MDEHIKTKILALLDQHRIMTIATLRPDGWPQATTGGYTPQVMDIAGLSMAARATPVLDSAEAETVLRMLMAKYPPQGNLPLAMPTPADVRIFHVTPTVISVLDYSKGFGHTDLVSC
jgi:hypothetical protein